jgi:hypothetical protein
MAHLIPMFKFTLGHGQSIGPAALRTLWEQACGTRHVSVSRQAGGFGGDGRPTYSLMASQHLADLPQVEIRLRRALDAQHLRASLVALHA